MGRNKLEIKKLPTSVGRQVTFSKRKIGIMKKARELAILCDVNVLLVVFSTAGKPACCLGGNSEFKDVIYKYAGLSPQERLKRKLENLKALRKTFKKVNHDVNVDQLNNPDSYEVEELNQALLTCRDEITQALSFLGPLAEFDSINHIEDPNKLIAMERQINYFLAKNQENAKYYAENVMNQFHQNEELGSVLYPTPNGHQIMLPCDLVASQRDLSENKLGHEAPINHPTQDTTWDQINGTQQTITNELPGLMHIPRVNSTCMESSKMNVIPENKGCITGNQNDNQNQFVFVTSIPNAAMNATSYEAGGLLQAMTSNESNDFIDDFLLQDDNAYCYNQANN